MRILFLLVVTLLTTQLQGQDSLNISVSYNDFIDTLTPNYGNNFYSECWGFEYNNKDYAVISSTAGAHFYDVTDPNNCSHVAYEAGDLQGYFANWRDYHDYQNYIYAVSDVYGGSLQIIDLSELPLNVNKVYDSKDLIETAHNIFIDTAKARLYACGGDRANGTSFDFAVFDISEPENPVHLIDYNDVGYIHDCFVRNDTAYLEAPNSQEMYVVNFADIANIQILGSISYYTDMGYTHSGWLTEDGNYYVMLDETVGSQIKILDVSDLTDIEEIDVFGSNTSPTSMAHNVIIRDNFAYVSYYNDGIHIFDISDPYNVVQAGYYDTYSLPDTINYKGVWGIYPFANGKIIASDRQSGLYVFDTEAALNYNTIVPETDFDHYFWNNQIVFADSSLNNPDSFLWIFGDGQISTEQNPALVFNDSLANDSLEVCLITSNYAGSDTLCQEVLIVIPPIADFSFTQNDYTDSLVINFTDNSSNFPTSWVWDFGNGESSFDQTPGSISLDDPTNVCLTVYNAAGFDQYCEMIPSLVALGTHEKTVHIYPNPVKNTMTLQGMQGEFEIRLYNSKMQFLQSYTNQSTLDFSIFTKGIYFITIKQDGKILSHKVIKT